MGNGLRPHLLDVAYLLCGFEAFGSLWTATGLRQMARVVFGAERLAAQLARVDAVLTQEGYAAEGTPQFCGLFIGGEKARLVQDDPALLKVTAEIPMTRVEQLLNQGQIAAAESTLEELQDLPPPSPPSAVYLTNPSV